MAYQTFGSATSLNIKSTNNETYDEVLHKINVSLHRELSDCFTKLHLSDEHEPELLKSIATLECAIDIIDSANTLEEQQTVYNILKSFKFS